jgi:hypothetical protein
MYGIFLYYDLLSPYSLHAPAAAGTYHIGVQASTICNSRAALFGPVVTKSPFFSIF